MANERETSVKRGRKPGNGGTVLPDAPKPFSSTVQPTPEQKSAGWKKKRAERLLTQAILEYMTDGQNLDAYVKSLYKNATKGNPKAIETINKGIEDDIIKVAATDKEGNDVKLISYILDERYKPDTGKDNASIPA